MSISMELFSEKLKNTIKPIDNTVPESIDEKFKLSFAFQELTEINEKMLPKNCDTILMLDLTENSFTGSNGDLKFLMDFPNLKTLILDKNQIQSKFIIPLMSNLTTLWLNHNQIENLSIFIENLTRSTPNLTYLSMMNNKAAPSYFNGGTLIEYNDYRLYVISKLTKLQMLDDKEISPEEKSQAKVVYGIERRQRRSSRLNSSKSQSEPDSKRKSRNSLKQIETPEVNNHNKNETLERKEESMKNKEKILQTTDKSIIKNKVERIESNQSEVKKDLNKNKNKNEYLNILPDVEKSQSLPILVENLSVSDERKNQTNQLNDMTKSNEMKMLHEIQDLPILDSIDQQILASLPATSLQNLDEKEELEEVLPPPPPPTPPLPPPPSSFSSSTRIPSPIAQSSISTSSSPLSNSSSASQFDSYILNNQLPSTVNETYNSTLMPPPPPPPPSISFSNTQDTFQVTDSVLLLLPTFTPPPPPPPPPSPPPNF